MADDDNVISENKIKDLVEQVVKKELKKDRSESDLKMPEPEQQAAVDCSNVRNISLQTMHYCEEMGGKFTDPEILNVLHDCAEFCELMNSLLLRQSRLKAGFAELCFHACDACVKLAENFPETEEMKALLLYAKIAGESVKKIT